MAKLIEITGKAVSGEWGADDLDGTGIPVLRTTNFTNTGMVNYNNVVTRQIKKKNLSEKMLQYGDIILEKSGGSDKQPVGRVIFFEGEGNKYLFNNFTGLLRVKNKDKWLPKYVFYALFANYYAGGTIHYENKTTGLHNLQTDNYVALTDIPDCVLSTQQEIVSKLDKVSDLIEKRRQQLDTLDQLVKSRFIELFGEEKSHSEPLKSFLEDITYGFTNPMPDATEGPWKITAKDVVNGKVNFDTARKTTAKAFDGLTEKSKPTIGDVLLTKDGTLGRCAVVEEDRICVNQSVAVLKCNEKILPKFLAALLQMPEYQREMLKNAGGGTIKHIYITKVVDMLVRVPTISQQTEFLFYVEQTDKSKLAIQKSLYELETLKKALMQEYFG